MRLNEPRIAPLEKADWTEDQAELLSRYETDQGVLNIYRTIGRNPAAARAFLGWGRFVRLGTSLSQTQSELVILRIGWLCKSGYEFTQHARLALKEGLTPEEIERIKIGPASPLWSEEQRLLLRAADELHQTYFIADGTWEALKAHLTEEQMMDLVYVVGHYTQVCMILNTFGVQVEPHQTMDPSLRA